ncbi:MAG: hypothetical protein ACXVLT_01590, partial [Flavisolibacter sp.]
ALAILFVLTVIVISLLFLYRTPSDRIFVTRIKTNTLVYNDSKNFGLVAFGSQQKVDSGIYVTNQLAEEGDVFFTNSFYFAFRSKMDSFQISERDSVLYINSALAGISLDSGRKSSAWFEKVPSDSLNHLQTLIIQFPLWAGELSELKRISDHRKNVSVCIVSDDDSPEYETNIQTIAKLFTPEILYLEVRNQKDLPSLVQFKTVKTLILDFIGPCDQALPALSNVRQCILGLDDTQPINSELFNNNKQLERLTIKAYEKTSISMSIIKNLPALKELSLDGSKYFDVDSLHQIAPRLRTLVLGDSCKNIAAVSKFQDLKWLGLPTDINQKDFDAILNGLPGLEVLEMYGSDSIKNISSIEGLKDLKGLVIAHQLPDSNRLFKFKQLRYLSIPEEKYKDSLFRQKLAKALPGCIIVPNAGACLGSGWLLLLVPFITIIVYFRRRIEDAARQL